MQAGEDGDLGTENAELEQNQWYFLVIQDKFANSSPNLFQLLAAAVLPGKALDEGLGEREQRGGYLEAPEKPDKHNLRGKVSQKVLFFLQNLLKITNV